MTYDHIPANDGRCWCAPKVFVFEDSAQEEIWPGVFVTKKQSRIVVFHFLNSLEARAGRLHGRPRRPTHVGHIGHI